MRKSGILYPNILKNMDPIMFHVPINGVLEWCTVEDSGRLLANLCAFAVTIVPFLINKSIMFLSFLFYRAAENLPPHGFYYLTL